MEEKEDRWQLVFVKSCWHCRDSQGASEALRWQRLFWQKQLENVLRLKHRQISITPVDTNDLHFKMPEAHTAS